MKRPGSGCLCARREVQHPLEPLVESWGWQPQENTLLSLDSAGNTASHIVPEQEWQATRDMSAYLSVTMALRALLTET